MPVPTPPSGLSALPNPRDPATATLRKRRLPSHLARPSPPLTHFQKLVRRGPSVPSDASFNRFDYSHPVPLLSRQPFLEQFTSYELQHFALHGHVMRHCRWVATPTADQVVLLDRLERARRDPFFRPYAESAIRRFNSRLPHEPAEVVVEGFQPRPRKHPGRLARRPPGGAVSGPRPYLRSRPHMRRGGSRTGRPAPTSARILHAGAPNLTCAPRADPARAKGQPPH